MRTLLLAGAVVISVAGPSALRAADIYQPVPGYTQAPPAYQPLPPDYGPPPPAYRLPPRYSYAPYPPQAAYGPPPVVAYEDDEVAPPRVYRDAPVYAQRPRYDCWWEWGQRRCAPRHGW